MNTSCFKFRTANNNDIENIMQIEEQSFSSGIKESKDTFIERVSVFPLGFLVADTTELNKTVGYISSELWHYRDVIKPNNLELGHSIKDTHNPAGDELYISSMGILPEFRGKGLGKSLFNELLNRIILLYPNIKSAVLIVSENWPRAKKIYMDNGFKEVVTINNFFQPVGLHGQNGIVMRKLLTNASKQII